MEERVCYAKAEERCFWGGFSGRREAFLCWLKIFWGGILGGGGKQRATESLRENRGGGAFAARGGVAVFREDKGGSPGKFMIIFQSFSYYHYLSIIFLLLLGIVCWFECGYSHCSISVDFMGWIWIHCYSFFVSLSSW